MAFLDFRLRHLLESPVPETDPLRVLVQFEGDVGALKDAGFAPSSVIGDVAAGSIPFERLRELQEHESVLIIEPSRCLKDEVDASCVAIGLVNPATDLRTIPAYGEGALIGIIDSGFDLTHPCFRSANGGTRILVAWDQAKDCSSGLPPPKFPYGIEYSRQFIDEKTAQNEILIIANKTGGGGHGTQVGAIAAGSGSFGVLTGVASLAELILVVYRNDVPIGGSAFVIDAMRYIADTARALKKPVVINISQGDQIGAHDGTSLLERAIDNLVRQEQVLVVVSAGNERNGPVSHRACGTVKQGKDFVLPFTLDQRQDLNLDTIELWYGSKDRFAIELKTPAGWCTGTIPPDSSSIIRFPFGNTAAAFSDVNHPANAECHVGIIFNETSQWDRDGEWQLIISAENVKDGAFDVWADRPGSFTAIGFTQHTSDSTTVTLPGTSREAITVGSFVSRPAVGFKGLEVKGQIETGSSFGPTRDGRIKPDLVAPGALVLTPGARPVVCPACVVPRRGTSFAAAHVSGAIALMWGLWPELPAAKIRKALYSTARKDNFTGRRANSSAGFGKLDIKRAYTWLR